MLLLPQGRGKQAKVPDGGASVIHTLLVVNSHQITWLLGMEGFTPHHEHLSRKTMHEMKFLHARRFDLLATKTQKKHGPAALSLGASHVHTRITTQILAFTLNLAATACYVHCISLISYRYVHHLPALR